MLFVSLALPASESCCFLETPPLHQGRLRPTHYYRYRSFARHAFFTEMAHSGEAKLGPAFAIAWREWLRHEPHFWITTRKKKNAGLERALTYTLAIVFRSSECMTKHDCIQQITRLHSCQRSARNGNRINRMRQSVTLSQACGSHASLKPRWSTIWAYFNSLAFFPKKLEGCILFCNAQLK